MSALRAAVTLSNSSLRSSSEHRRMRRMASCGKSMLCTSKCMHLSRSMGEIEAKMRSRR